MKATYLNSPRHAYCRDVINSDTRIVDSIQSQMRDSESNLSGTRFCPALPEYHKPTFDLIPNSSKLDACTLVTVISLVICV